MSNNKFESLLELLINEENDKAEALFHEIVVEKSRDIYENLADEEVTAESKDEEVKETEASEEKVEETTEEKVEETDELKEEELKEDCGCGHGSDCDCGPDCGCGCNESVTEEVEAVTIQDAVNESQERLKYLISR